MKLLHSGVEIGIDSVDTLRSQFASTRMNAAVRTVRRCLQRVRNTLDGTAVQLSAVEQEKLYLPFAEEWKNILIEPGGTPLDCVCIEDYSRWTLSTPEITNKIRELDALIKRNEQKISKIVRFAQLFVNDVLFFSSIVPSVLIQWDGIFHSLNHFVLHWSSQFPPFFNFFKNSCSQIAVCISW